LARGAETSTVLGLLGSVEDQAVFDLFMQLIREKQLSREASVQGSGISMSGPVTTWVFNHRNDARVVETLENADPQLRAMLEAPKRTGNVVLRAPTEPIIPSNLLKRMREVIENPAPPSPSPPTP
jgi:hypothetical protein